MLWYFDLFLRESWFSGTNNCSFCNKTTQDFAEFWEIWENFKAKTKTEDEGILRKGKRSSSWFFSLRIGLAGREENQISSNMKHSNHRFQSMMRTRCFLSISWKFCTDLHGEFGRFIYRCCTVSLRSAYPIRSAKKHEDDRFPFLKIHSSSVFF